MKKTISIIVITLLVVSVGYAIYNKFSEPEQVGGWFATSNSLVGTSANLRAVPKAAVFANSTTTNDLNYNDGLGTVTQLVDTNDKEEVMLNIMAIGPNATSTLYIRQMGSHDGTNYFDIATSTPNEIATSTVNALPVKAVQWDPGVATTSISILFDTKGYRNTRFIIWSEGWTGDLDTGIQAWITSIPIETKH